jgi:hypothetical protein
MKTLLLTFTLLFIGCVDKHYTYRSTISDANLSTYLNSSIKQKESLYQVRTTLRTSYFFSEAEAKKLLSKEILKTVRTLCKEKHKRYFAIITPKELSNYPHGSLVTTEKEFIEKLQRKNFTKEGEKNNASLEIHVLLLKDKALDYLVWDSKNY